MLACSYILRMDLRKEVAKIRLSFSVYTDKASGFLKNYGGVYKMSLEEIKGRHKCFLMI
jgi:hypothetical protein